MPSKPAPRYVDPHQARTRPPSDYENRLGDALEAAFEAGAWDLPELVACLNESRTPAPDGKPWTVESFPSHLQLISRNVAYPEGVQ